MLSRAQAAPLEPDGSRPYESRALFMMAISMVLILSDIDKDCPFIYSLVKILLVDSVGIGPTSKILNYISYNNIKLLQIVLAYQSIL